MWKSAHRLIRRFRDGQRQGPSKVQLSAKRITKLTELEEKLGYRFANRELLEQALTHKSYTHEQGNGECRDYEALEFLGDSILGFVMSEFLFLTYPELSEGDLSKMKSHLVSAHQLHQLSRELGLGQFLNLSRGEERTGGREKKALLADLFESLTAAVYLDGGIGPAREFIVERFKGRFEAMAGDELPFRDHKSALQERLHGMGLPSPEYRVTKETGPDHKKEFLVSVRSEGVALGSGTGPSKKAAEQDAARKAIASMDADGHQSDSPEVEGADSAPDKTPVDQ